MHAADQADVPIGLWMTCRAHSEEDARAEMQELKNCIQVAKVASGVWLHLKLTKSVTTNDRIVRIYREKLHELGLHQKIGFYVTAKELKSITWEYHCDDWYLWLVDHVDDTSIDMIDDLLTPEFFQIERSSNKEDWVVDKESLQTDFGRVIDIGGDSYGDAVDIGDLGSVEGGTKITYKSSSGQAMDYWAYLPATLRQNMPLIVFLHGSGEVGSSSAVHTVGGMIKSMQTIYPNNSQPFVAITPCCPSGGWYNHLPMVKGCIEDAIQRFNSNTNKIAMTGHSLGGYGTISMIERYGSYFNCAYPLSGCNSSMNINDNMLSVPWTMSAGGAESGICSAMKALADRIVEKGGSARYWAPEGIAHGPAQHACYTKEMFEWMISQ